MDTSILIVDDEQDFLDSVVRGLRIEGYDDLTPIVRSADVPALLEKKSFDCAFVDISMPELDGIELLKIIKERSPQTECIMVTAHESVPLVIKAIKLGAYDYLVKPTTPEQLTHALDRALERRRLLEALLLRADDAHDRALDRPEAFEGFITADPRTIRLLREAELHAVSRIPVLITGETGVGKEVLAQAIHRASRRSSGPFVPVNMLAVTPSLFESELFGHKKGAFSGADRDRQGYLAQARGGTLFLDEIGDLSLEAQGKLLRILQEGEYVPVGATRAEQANVRIVAATNQDLEKLVSTRRFRKDLLYRLQFAHLQLPPLRRRADDIPLLGHHLLGVSETHPDATLSAQAELSLIGHDWPGNVRELKGVLEAAANLARGGVIEPEHLRLGGSKPAPIKGGDMDAEAQLEPLAEVERRHILAVYEAVGHNKSQAARTLEIGLQTLHRKLKAYGAK